MQAKVQRTLQVLQFVHGSASDCRSLRSEFQTETRSQESNCKSHENNNNNEEIDKILR